MDVVVVESPAKARAINKYLGSGYTVLASYGHVRDLPAKDGSVQPDKAFNMIWEVDPRAEKHLKAIATALKRADRLYLATDPDREGEAISWHVQEVLKERHALKDVEVQRVVFHEVTKNAVLEAMKHPRGLDKELVDAYLARRALDYLVGFNLSPILWRKLPGSRSAGRVQSVALRLVCERESEIEVFKAKEYWTVEAEFRTPRGQPFIARLTHLDGKRLDRLGVENEAAATAAVEAIKARKFAIEKIEKKDVRRYPAAPFTTSTLQQEGARKLGFSPRHTMRVAQHLYEGVDISGDTVGLITYMRTDSVIMAKEAVDATRALVKSRFGGNYVPATPHQFKSKTRNAQEAHEAIRPTDVSRTPERVAGYLDVDGRKLYELIWKRAVAANMEAATLAQVAADVGAPDKAVTLRATGQIIKFDGFLKLYREDRDESAEGEDEDNRILPEMAEGEPVQTGAITPEQHFTKPPPRFTEASLVKRLEELGIGRPSTYASIISVLQDRKYVRLERGRFIPEDRGRLVTAFLTGFFDRYVQYNFTADLEDKLDDVSNGQIDWKTLLQEFWQAFFKALEETRPLRISEVIDALDAELGPHFFPVTNGLDPRKCPAGEGGRLGLKLSRHGAFIGCSNYPSCTYTRPLAVPTEGGNGAELAGPRELGTDPKTGLLVTLRKGPYGFYVQLGEAVGKEKPKRASLLKGMDPGSITLEQALGLLSLPREIGLHPETGQMILAGVGRFGPYLKHGDSYASLKGDDDVLTTGLNRAVVVLAEKAQRKGSGGRMAALRNLGPHPADNQSVTVHSGKYGPYVKHGKLNATIPSDKTPEAIMLEEAIALLDARAQKTGKGKPAKAPKKKAAAAPDAEAMPAEAKAKPARKRAAKKPK
ncbi:MAG TPA: type I DNA topoisomerase [Alphaproteobacteria bacterium]